MRLRVTAAPILIGAAIGFFYQFTRNNEQTTHVPAAQRRARLNEYHNRVDEHTAQIHSQTNNRPHPDNNNPTPPTSPPNNP